MNQSTGTKFASGCAARVCAVATIMYVSSPASAQCPGIWGHAVGQPGVDHDAQVAVVTAMSVFEPPGGSAGLYVGGIFTSAGGLPASNIARWDGKAWSALGNGVDGTVIGLTTFDDGSGTALYVGGTFTVAGGVPASAVAKWDGTSWSPLGAGVSGGSTPTVRALAVFDDGSGPALYVGGVFTNAGGVPASRIAKWDGTSWSALGSGVSSTVYALTVFDDGDGPALYAAGAFTTAGGAPASRVAKWNGSTWSAVGNELFYPCDDPSLNCAIGWTLAAFDGELYLGGNFITAGGAQASYLVRLEGSQWIEVGGGLNERVRTIKVFDDGSGPALYVGGIFQTAGEDTIAQRIARWDGSTWSALGAGTSTWVRALGVFDDGEESLFVGGEFTFAGGQSANRVARWRGPGSLHPADLNCDGVVGVADLLILLAEWGPCPMPAVCPADFDSSGDVGVSDLLFLLANWG